MSFDACEVPQHIAVIPEWATLPSLARYFGLGQKSWQKLAVIGIFRTLFGAADVDEEAANHEWAPGKTGAEGY